jgi:hypothetical protein
MGSITDSRNASRAAAVLAKDPDFLAGLKSFVGSTILEVGVEVNEPIGTIKAFYRVATPDGEVHTIDGPTLMETYESGVLGFDLDERYSQDELRGLMEAAAADPENDLDDQDREGIREEIEELGNFYV